MAAGTSTSDAPLHVGSILTISLRHAYKFLPSIGERIVDVIQGRDRDELGAELRQRWKWPQRMKEDHVWTNDWRGSGPKGLILQEEYKKGPLAAQKGKL